MLDTTTGEMVTMALKHEGNNVREFYSKLPRPVRVGIEATGSMQWFVNLGPALWSQDGQRTIASLPLAPYAAYRRSELQAMYAKFGAEIEKLNQRVGVEEQACERPGARLLITHLGVGPITALATEVFLGDAARFADSKALASYVG
jgi:transposase